MSERIRFTIESTGERRREREREREYASLGEIPLCIFQSHLWSLSHTAPSLHPHVSVLGFCVGSIVRAFARYHPSAPLSLIAAEVCLPHSFPTSEPLLNLIQPQRYPVSTLHQRRAVAAVVSSDLKQIAHSRSEETCIQLSISKHTAHSFHKPSQQQAILTATIGTSFNIVLGFTRIQDDRRLSICGSAAVHACSSTLVEAWRFCSKSNSERQSQRNH